MNDACLSATRIDPVSAAPDTGSAVASANRPEGEHVTLRVNPGPWTATSSCVAGFSQPSKIDDSGSRNLHGDPLLGDPWLADTKNEYRPTRVSGPAR